MQVGLSESRKFCSNLCSRDDLRQGAILWNISVLYYQCNFFRVCRRPDETENTFLKKDLQNYVSTHTGFNTK